MEHEINKYLDRSDRSEYPTQAIIKCLVVRNFFYKALLQRPCCKSPGQHLKLRVQLLKTRLKKHRGGVVKLIVAVNE